MNGRFMAVWGMPILLGILTTIGLVSALFGDGVWDAVSALTLGAPVAVGAWYSLRRKKHG
ncbi:hypothetical protein ACSUZJ_11485 [Telluria sp. B2]